MMQKVFAANILPILLLISAAPPAAAQEATAMSAGWSRAADKIEIQELGAAFDNALDAEDADKFVSVFVDDGILEGFWGQSKGRAALKQAHAFMLATFAKDKRHVVTNHEISVADGRATMFSYLTVFDRKSLGVTGTATFTDELVRQDGRWKFVKRVLRADPNVDAIIKSLPG